MKAFKEAFNTIHVMRVWFFIGLVYLIFYSAMMFYYSGFLSVRLWAAFWFVWTVLTYIRWQVLRKKEKMLDTLQFDNCVDCGSEYTRLDDKPVCWNCGNNLTYDDVFKVAKEEHFSDDTELHAEMRRIWINRMFSHWSTWNKPKNKNHN